MPDNDWKDFNLGNDDGWEDFDAMDIQPRQSQWKPLMDITKNIIQNPFSGAMKYLTPSNLQGQTELGQAVMGGAWKTAEAIPANIALQAQSGQLKPQSFNPLLGLLTDNNYREAISSAITGEKSGEFGDVFSKANFPFPQQLGFLTSIALPGMIGKSFNLQGTRQSISRNLQQIKNIVPNLINLGGKKTGQKIAEKADKGMESLSKKLGESYDDLFGKIDGKTNTVDVISDLQSTLDEFPEGANVGKIKSIIKRIKGKKEISARELFNIKKEISKTISPNVWNGVADADAMTNSREQLYWKLSKRLEKLGGEKYSGLTEEYKTFKQSERLARKMFYRQGVPSNAPLGGTYDVPTQRAVRSLSGQLPPEQQFSQAFEAWRRGQNVKKVALGGGALTLGDYLVRRWISGLASNRND